MRFEVAPLAVITAPEKRCGKSQLLSVLGRLVRRPLPASNITASAMFRAMDAWKPTLLVDEADAFMREKDDLRGILNAGHTRDSAYVVRVVGDDHRPKRFNTWGCKAIAGIGRLADTLMDRSIVLQLRRKLPHEKVERLRHADPGDFNEIVRKLARISGDYQDTVRRAKPTLPAELHDRAQDNWEPLLAVADIAGGDWPMLARRAALKLSRGENSAVSAGTELLADIREIFEQKKVDRISTADLIAALCEDSEKSWATFNRGGPISPHKIAKLLGEYGIVGGTIRIDPSSTPKGYLRNRFEEVFERYLPARPAASATTPQPTPEQGFGVADRKTRCDNIRRAATPKSPPPQARGAVAEEGNIAGGSEVFELTP